MDGFRDISTATPLQEELGMSLTMSPWKDYKDSDESIKESHISAGAAQMPCITLENSSCFEETEARVFPSGRFVGLCHDFVPSIKALFPPQKFPENNSENNSLLLRIPQLVNVLWKNLEAHNKLPN